MSAIGFCARNPEYENSFLSNEWNVRWIVSNVRSVIQKNYIHLSPCPLKNEKVHDKIFQRVHSLSQFSPETWQPFSMPDRRERWRWKTSKTKPDLFLKPWIFIRLVYRIPRTFHRWRQMPESFSPSAREDGRGWRWPLLLFGASLNSGGTRGHPFNSSIQLPSGSHIVVLVISWKYIILFYFLDCLIIMTSTTICTGWKVCPWLSQNEFHTFDLMEIT